MGGHNSGNLFPGTSSSLTAAQTDKQAASTGQESLKDELEARGEKFTRENVVAIGKDKDDRIVWLETGNTGERGSGLAHIIEQHESQFSQHGVSEQEIPNFIMKAVTEGAIVGYQGRGTGRPIYEVFHNGKIHSVAVTIGSNGYIVGANHRGFRE